MLWFEYVSCFKVHCLNKCQFSSLLRMHLRKPHYLKHDKIFKSINRKILHCVFSSVMPQILEQNQSYQ